ncbi:DnaJ-like protein xdj1 [Savitreella phatthalungensis]
MAVDTALYDLLGVSPSAGQDDIKRAYHKLARKAHPDKVAPEEREAASATFRQIQEAYDVLREPESRAAYDETGYTGSNGSNPHSQSGGVDLDDLFASMFSGPPGGSGGGHAGASFGGPGKYPGRRGGRPQKVDAEHDYPVTLNDLYKGKSTKLRGVRNKLCPVCHGSGCRTGHKPSACASCDGKGTKAASMMLAPGMYTQQQVECPSCSGTGEAIRDRDRCKKCKGAKVVDEPKLMEVYIDRGAHDGDRIVLREMADQVPGGETGDVIITLRQKPHDIFDRRGSDLQATIHITLAEALTGFSRVVLTHLDGRKLRYTSKQGTVVRPDDVLVARGEGMPLGKRRDGFGDLYLVVKVDFPSDDFLSERGEYQRLAQLLPQKTLPAQSNGTPADPEAIEDELDLAKANLDEFGGDYAEDEDWEDEDGAHPDPNVTQCAQQ